MTTTSTFARRLLTIAAPITLTGLVLAGCSSTPAPGETQSPAEPNSSNVFEFQTNGIEPSDEITILVPEDLREAMGADAGAITTDEIVASSHPLDGVGLCAVDLAISYASGQPDAITAANSPEGMRQKAEDRLLSETGSATIDELITNTDQVIADAQAAGTPVVDILRAKGYGLLAEYYGPEHNNTGQKMIDYYFEDTTADAGTSGAAAVAQAFGFKDAESIGEFSPADPVEGVYLSDDLATITVVDDCAASTSDPDNAIEIDLPMLDADGAASVLGTVQLSVMTDGSIGVSGQVEDYMRDANDNWIAQ